MMVPTCLKINAHKVGSGQSRWIVCSSHVAGVRIYRQAAAFASVSEKAKQASKEMAKRLGKWMGRLKQSSTSGLSSRRDDADQLGDFAASDSIGELKIVGSDGRSQGGPLHTKDRPVLPKLVRVQFVASILTISRMTRKKTMPDIVTLYFGDDVQIMCKLADPELCIRAMRTKAIALDKAGLRKVADRRPSDDQTQEGHVTKTSATALESTAGNTIEDESDGTPAVPSAPRPTVDGQSGSPPVSPIAAADAFSFGDGDSDSDEDVGSNSNSENPFDNW